MLGRRRGPRLARLKCVPGGCRRFFRELEVTLEPRTIAGCDLDHGHGRSHCEGTQSPKQSRRRNPLDYFKRKRPRNNYHYLSACPPVRLSACPPVRLPASYHRPAVTT